MNVEATQTGMSTLFQSEEDAQPLVDNAYKGSPNISITIQQPTGGEPALTTAVESFMKPLSEMFSRLLESIKGLVDKLTERTTPAASTTPSPFEIIDGPKRAKRNKHGKTQPSSSSSKAQGISGGFLWKPSSDSDGKLVILLPSALTGKVSGVRVLDASGTKELAEGKFSAVANGNREHFRFSKPGNNFPAGSIVEVQMRDGSVKRIVIDSPGGRLEG